MIKRGESFDWLDQDLARVHGVQHMARRGAAGACAAPPGMQCAIAHKLTCVLYFESTSTARAQRRTWRTLGSLG